MKSKKIIDIINNNASFIKLMPQSIKEKIINDANDLVNGKICFNNAWDMERCDQEYVLVNNKSYYTPNGDPEWVYMYSRLEFLHKLVLAFILDNNEKYIKSYFYYVDNFFEQNNSKNGALKVYKNDIISKVYRRINRIYRIRILHLPERHATYRTLDTAIRNYALTIDALYLKWILPDDNDVKKIETRINKDASFTIAGFTEFDEYSNWGLIKILLYATYLIICGANDIDEYECCIKRLLDNQIRKDGGHIENSNMYHVQILICLLRLIYWAENNEVAISEEIKDKARKMALFTYRLCDPLGNQIMYGDSDYTSTNTVLFIASELLDFNYTLNHGEPDDYILFYEFPTLISKIKLKSKKKEKKVQNIELDGGIWCFDNDDWCIRAFNESSKSGHKHADNGEIVVYYHSRPVIIDAGRCTYYESKKRIYYRGPFAHNIAVIDNAEEWEPYGNWEFKENPSNIYNKKESCFPGYKMSYVFSSKQYVFKRYIMLYNDTLIIISFVNLIGGGTHQLKTIWNFAYPVFKKDGILYTSDKIAISFTGNINIKSGRVSLAYNEEQNIGSHVEISSDFDTVGLQITCLSIASIKIVKHNQFLYSIDDMKNPKLFIRIQDNEINIIK